VLDDEEEDLPAFDPGYSGSLGDVAGQIDASLQRDTLSGPMPQTQPMAMGGDVGPVQLDGAKKGEAALPKPEDLTLRPSRLPPMPSRRSLGMSRRRYSQTMAAYQGLQQMEQAGQANAPFGAEGGFDPGVAGLRPGGGGGDNQQLSDILRVLTEIRDKLQVGFV